MAGTLRDIRELETEIEAAGLRGITKQQILDALKSQAKVGGCMSINGGTTPFTLSGGSWNRINVWERSVDTQGVQNGLVQPVDPGGYYKIRNVAGGDYTVGAYLRFTASLAATYEIRVAVIQEDLTVKSSPYHDAVTLTAGAMGILTLQNGIIKDVSRNERIQLEIKGVNNSQITITHGQFGVQR